MSEDQQTIFCPSCGSGLPAGARFCASCGTSIEGAPAPAAAPLTDGAETRSRKKWAIPLGIGAVVAVGAVIAVAILGRGGGGSSDAILLGQLDSRGDMEVHAIDLGEEPTRDNRVLDDVNYLTDIYVVEDNDRFVGTVPAVYINGMWLTEYHIPDDDGRYVASIAGDEVFDIYDDESDWGSTYWLADSTTLRIVEQNENGSRCHVSEDGEDTDRVARGTGCWWTSGGVAWSYTSDDESIEIDVAHKDGTSYAIERDDYAGNWVLSDDAKYAAIALYNRDEVYVEFVEMATDTVILESDRFDSHGYSRSTQPNGSRVALGMRDNGRDVLLLFDPAAVDVLEVEDGDRIDMPPGSSHGFVRLDDDGDTAIARMDLATGELDELFDASGYIATGLTPDGWLYAFGFEDRDAWIVSPNGEAHDLGRVGSGDKIDSYTSIPIDDNRRLFRVTTFDEEGMWVNSVFVLDFAQATVTELLGDWSTIYSLNVADGGRTAVFAGFEDDNDDPALWALAIDGSAGPIELDDDADHFTDVSPRGAVVYYTARIGDDYDDYEVRQVSISGEEQPEVLHTEARLLATAWDEPSGST